MKRLKQIFIAVEEQIHTVCPHSKLYATWCRGCRRETEFEHRQNSYFINSEKIGLGDD